MFSSRGFSLIGTLVIVLGLVVAACAPAAAPTAIPTVAPVSVPQVAPTPTPARAAEEPARPRPGGILIMASEGDPPSLDPNQETTVNTHMPIGPIYNKLVKFDLEHQSEIIGDLAEKWEVSSQGDVYTFHLRKGVKWHDGRPFTAEDVKYSLDRIILQPAGMRSSPGKANYTAVSKVEAVDVNTVKVTLKYPNASFLAMAANGRDLIVPKHILEAEGQMTLTKKAVGTGPFKFKEYMRGVSTEGVRNPDYFVKDRPYLDGYKFLIIPDPSARLAALRTGQIDLIRETPGILPSEVTLLQQKMKDIVIKETPSLTPGLLLIRWEKEPFKDIRVRQALSLAIDRKAFAQAVYQGRYVVSGPMAPFGKWALPQEEMAKMPGYGPDPEANRAQAKRLLAEAGLPDGFKTGIPTRTGLEYVRATEFISGELRKIGVSAEIRPTELAVLYGIMEPGNFEIVFFSFGIPVDDPDMVFGVHFMPSTRNYNKYYNPRLAELSAEQAGMMDPVARKKIVDEMSRIVLNDAGTIILGYQIRTVAHWPQVKDYRPAVDLFSATRLEDVWLAR